MSEGRSSRAIPWARIAAEGVAIVISILLAFSIDAWWEARQDLKAERVHLTALRVQFAEVARIIDTELDELEAASAAAQWLLSLTPDEAAAESTDSIADNFLAIFRLGRANLPSGALDALMASGNLSLIADPDLAAHLAAWPAAVAEVYENAGWLVEQREDRLVPFLTQYVGGLWIGTRSGLLSNFPTTRFPPRIEGLFSDRGLESNLSNAAVRMQVLRDRYLTLGREADAIMALIDERLDRDAA